jgi:hypothetical protein
MAEEFLNDLLMKFSHLENQISLFAFAGRMKIGRGHGAVVQRTFY